MERESILESKIGVLNEKIAKMEKCVKVLVYAYQAEIEMLHDKLTRAIQVAEYWKNKALEK